MTTSTNPYDLAQACSAGEALDLVLTYILAVPTLITRRSLQAGRRENKPTGVSLGKGPTSLAPKGRKIMFIVIDLSRT